ncbi:uncharacterized protein LOC133966673 isoform X1 [Platichthys flesus]|uniref:uncharacterized protein LOC133965588 isoform X1 n=1 Tax=Platichthys flesus TaxID=8260 RepID=UPI002DB56F6A|nr:uncharacterized protein LOC133965588 isoform X1 [Platichthys flesus]XP_062257674.1 uncharacterized protein LOC133966673 isoform X1 [Platichthys flesus]
MCRGAKVKHKKCHHGSAIQHDTHLQIRGPVYLCSKSIDAFREDGSIGVNGEPHLCLFALDDIKEGEEIAYNYGGEDCPWQTQVFAMTTGYVTALGGLSQLDGEDFNLCFKGQEYPRKQGTTSITVNTMEEDDSDPVHSESLMACAFGPKITPEEMKDTDLEDSELFDSSSESADDHVPDTISESDSDSDASVQLNFKNTFLPLNDPDSSMGPTVCDYTTPDNMILDGQNITPEAPRAVEEPRSSQTIKDIVR